MGLFIKDRSTASRKSLTEFFLLHDRHDRHNSSTSHSSEQDQGIVENFRIRINFKHRQALYVMTMRRNKQKDRHLEIETHFAMNKKTIKIQSVGFLHWILCNDLSVFFQMDKNVLRDTPVQIEYGYYQGEEEILGSFKDFHDDNFTEEMTDIILEYAKFMLQT